MRAKVNFNNILILILLFSSHSFGQDSLVIYRVPDANKIKVIVKADVNRADTTYKYSYKIISDAASEQDVDTYFFIKQAIIDSSKSPTNWIGPLPHEDVNKVFWGAIDSLAMIKPDSSLEGFILYSKGLPIPTVSYSMGWIDVPILEEEPDSVENDNIFENSLKGWTIGPKDPPDTHNSMIFLDSLTNYNNQAYSCGWIKQEATKNKYETYLTNAKTLLQQGDSLHARLNLENILRNVDIDSSGAITSEAYALLRYNTEYLLSFLPDVTEPRNDLTAKASAEITTANGLLQYSYTITNEEASNQSAANIYVEDTTTSTASAPVNWQTEKVVNILDRFYTTTNPITAGSIQSGYTVTSNSLPVIGKVYVQSERFTVDTADIKTNSYTVTTVVPSERPAQINASAFIDSLISYNNRAYSLGWMQYYWVRDNNYYQLNNAKTMINMNVPSSAVVILAAFEGWLDTCMSQSYFNKETYGLLKYNSIYLREKLSGQ
ncbi:MAG: hypothetical protein AB1432_11845 [Bacteroidota bacterium]